VNREQALPLLPCYVAGDLPDEVVRAIDELVRADDELRTLVEQLRAERREAVAALCRGSIPQDLLEALSSEDEVPATAPARARIPWAWVAAVGLVAVLVLTFATRSFLVPALPPVGASTEAAVAALYAAHELATTADLLDPTDEPALRAALDAAGVPDAVRVVPDLSHLGMTTRGVVVLPGETPGFAVVYERDGVLYVCQMWTHTGALAPPDEIANLHGFTVRGFEGGGRSLAVWRMPSMICVFSADVELPALLAVVDERLAPTG